MPAITRSRHFRSFRARAATVGTAALVMTALAACGSDDDSTDAASAPSFTSGSAASPEAVAGSDTVDASTGAVAEDASDDEADNAVVDAGDGRDVASIGTCVGGENITVNMDDAQPIITGGSVTLTGKNWGALTVNGDDASMTATTIGAATVNSDEYRVQNFGLDSLAITGDNNTVVGGTRDGDPVSDTGTGNTIL